jgi:hypothetical protein
MHAVLEKKGSGYFPCALKGNSHTYHNNLKGVHAGFATEADFEQHAGIAIAELNKAKGKWANVQLATTDPDFAMFYAYQAGLSGYDHTAVNPILETGVAKGERVYNSAWHGTEGNHLRCPPVSKLNGGVASAEGLRQPIDDPYDRVSALNQIYSLALLTLPWLCAACSRLRCLYCSKPAPAW